MDSVHLLDALAGWCLDHLPPDPPHLIGVVVGSESVSLHHLELSASDTLLDLESLVAPDEWDIAIVTCASGHPGPDGQWVRLAHATCRDGQSFTEFRSGDGTSATMRNAAGRIAELCRRLFGPPPESWADMGGAVRADVTASISERAE